MSKKFSIVKEIDLDKLRKQIELYRYETGEINPYIFMNLDTIKQIGEEVGVPVKTFCLNSYVGLFEGNKVFLHNGLNYGEVEIR